MGITSSFNKEPEYDSNYETHFVPPSKSAWVISSGVKRFIDENPKAVYHLHGAFIPVFFLIHKHIKRIGASFVFTPHGSYTQGAMSRSFIKKQLFFKLFEAPMLKAAKFIQVLGHMEESDTKQLYPKGVYQLIPNGQQVIKVEEENRARELLFGYCGRVTRFQKGLDLLVNGFVHYRKQGGTGKLWVIGDGEYLEEMKAIVHSAGLAASVVFWGAKFGDEKNQLMYQLTAFLHPSRNEGLPTAVLESSAMGVPLMVTKETSMDQYATNYRAGWVIQGLTSEAVSKAFEEVELVYKKDEIGVFRNNVLELFQKEFNWATIATNLIRAYES